MFLPMPPQTAAPARNPIAELYTKTEYSIPMRDGVKLYAQVYVPKAGGAHPILMERTPYGAGPAGATMRGGFRGSKKLVDAGYIFAYTDVRGKNASEGDFENVRPLLPNPKKGQIDEATDTWDTVEYLIRNVPDNNGRVGLWGISYPGFYAGAGAVRTHPALKAVSPQAPVSDWFLGDDVHHNGAFFIQESFDFNSGFDVPRGGQRPTIERGDLSAYDFYLQTGALKNFDAKHYKGLIPYWNEFIAHDTYDAYWKERSLTRNFRNVKCAVLTVGGWFDKEDMWGALNLYKAGERQNRGIANTIVMGPWTHGQWSRPSATSLWDQDWGSDTAKFYQDEVEFPFFERYLNAKPVAALPEALMFETGANVWRRYDRWPIASSATAMNLGADGTLSLARVAEGERTLTADPNAPTPYVDDWQTSKRAVGDWLIRDQRFLANRPDVLTWSGPVLEKDLRVGGAIEADVWLASTGTDGDLVVKVLDEFPASGAGVSPRGVSLDGYQMMVRSDVMRMKFRDSFERPTPLTPGKPTRVRFKLNDTLHTFRKGHRVVVQVQPYWFPIVDRNPNTFGKIHTMDDAEYRKADVTILSGGRTASRVVLPVLR